MDLEFLYSLKREGVKLDLDIMREFAPRLGNPQNKFKSFHIAGTNAKGSVSSFIYNIFRQRYSTGLYTSPHLVKFNERILVDKDFITNEYMETFMSKYLPVIIDLMKTRRNPTFFETTTLMAFDYFSSKKIEYGSIEVGLGGRLDSTNIINPEVSVICNIGYDHFDRLGCTLESIAYEKGGIIKNGKPVVLSDQKEEVVRTIRRISDLKNSRLFELSENSTASNVNQGIDGISFELEGMLDNYDIESRMLGSHQVKNIQTAILAAEVSGVDKIGRKEIEKGIREAIWPARMEIVSREPFVLVDCAHNPPAARALVTSYKKIFNEKTALLIGMLNDKDWYTFAHTISEIADEVIFTRPDEPERSLDPQEFSRYCGPFFKKSVIIQDIKEAYEYALQHYDRILVTGSIYLVGKIKEFTGSSLYPYIIE
ncbi:MAG: bifunctional folylpolyglutamate synthase/dihydrofolate synthase [Candidatus Thermoplasmatota archaeon]|nr:bifunctional folylpolyglutamate synthase/dihydrofolate synthase [Candidatus Thermoplasmatota archaeon]